MALTRAVVRQQKEEQDGRLEQGAKQLEEQEKTQQCHLFKLPGELRNRIYREVVVKPRGEEIIYTAAGYARPGLLATSKEIRAEAMSIFYYENEFAITISSYDSTPLLNINKCLERLESHGIRDSKTQIFSRTDWSQPCWRNLLEWTQRYHAEVGRGYIASPEVAVEDMNTSMHYVAVSGVFHVVKSLKAMAWAEVEEIVKGLRPVLVKADARWEED